ncbi:hypothetical protein [Nonomuraea sp. NPDC003754]
MAGLELVVVAAVGAGIAVVAKMSDGRKRTASDGKGRVPGAGSLLVKAYNSSGATPVASTRLSEAGAELAGRGTGRAVRAIRRASKAANQRMAANHTVRRGRWEARWAERQTRRPAETVLDRWRATRGQVGERHLGRRAVARARLTLGLPAQPATPAAGPQPTPNPRPEQAAPAPPSPPARPTPSSRTTPSGGTTMTATTDAPQTAPEGAVAPLDWQVMIDRVRNFVPESDSHLLEFMKAEAAGMVAYAEASKMRARRV